MSSSRSVLEGALSSKYHRISQAIHNVDPTGTSAHTLLAQAREVVEEFDANMLELKQGARMERERLIEKITRLGHTVSPFYRIPTEIWTKIFELACDPNAPLGLYPPTAIDTLGFSNPSLVISQVCRKWRHVIQSLPRFWTTISICDVDQLPSEYVSSFLLAKHHLLSTILRSSDTEPLHIALLNDGDPDVGSILVQHALPILMTHSWRWKTLHINDCQERSIVRSLAACRYFLMAQFPLLETLCIGKTIAELQEDYYILQRQEDNEGSSSGDSDDDDLPEPECASIIPFPYLGGFPQLRTLSLSGYCPAPLSLPWEWRQLTTVTFTAVGIDYFRRVLPHLRSIVQITFLRHPCYRDKIYSLDDDEMSDFTLQSLQYLQIPEWDDDLFTYLTAPMLQELHIGRLEDHEEGEGSGIDEVLNCIASFIARSGCSITCFRNDIAFLRPYHALDSFLPRLPDLQTLQLSQCRPLPAYQSERGDTSVTSLVINALAGKERHQHVNCPKLQEIEIKSLSLWSSPHLVTSLVDMIQGRWDAASADSPNHPSLRRITVLSPWFNDTPGQLDRLKLMESEGLEIYWEI